MKRYFSKMIPFFFFCLWGLSACSSGQADESAVVESWDDTKGEDSFRIDESALEVSSGNTDESFADNKENSESKEELPGNESQSESKNSSSQELKINMDVCNNEMVKYNLNAFKVYWMGSILSYENAVEIYNAGSLIQTSPRLGYVSWNLEEGGIFYMFFEEDSYRYENYPGTRWMCHNSIYKLGDLQYSDFGDLTGKTLDDVAEIDDVVRLYEELDVTSPVDSNLIESRHLLTDGILIIRYDRSQEKRVSEVIYNKDFVYELELFERPEEYPDSPYYDMCYFYYNIK